MTENPAPVTITLDLLKRLHFYSGCSEVRAIWDDNVLSFLFDWNDIDWHCRIEFDENKINDFKKNPHANMEDYIIEAINHLKRQRDDGQEIV